MASLATSRSGNTEQERRELIQRQNKAYQDALKVDQAKQRQNSPEEKIKRCLTEVNGLPQQIPYSYLQRITGSFADRNVVGKGASSVVYKGVDNNAFPTTTFAIKKLSDLSNEKIAQARKNAQNRKFRDEIEILTKFQHPNIIKLVGYSNDDGNKQGCLCFLYLCYENGSLNELLLDDKRAPEVLFWNVRIKIMLGIAKALNYLHRHDPKHAVFHRDIKSSNIVLDNAWNPLLIDCGLSWLLDDEQAERARTGQAITVKTYDIAGTPGYMCPTYVEEKRYSVSSEMYSVGCVALEIITGKTIAKLDSNGKSIKGALCKFANPYPVENTLLLDPPSKARSKSKEWLLNNADKRVGKNDLNDKKNIEELASIAINCLNIVPEKRGSMGSIVRNLQLVYKESYNEHEKALERQNKKLLDELALESSDKDASGKY